MTDHQAQHQLPIKSNDQHQSLLSRCHNISLTSLVLDQLPTHNDQHQALSQARIDDVFLLTETRDLMVAGHGTSEQEHSHVLFAGEGSQGVPVMTQSQAIVKSPPPLDVSSNVSAIVSKSTFDIQEHQVSAPSHSGDDVSRSDQYSTGSIPFEKRSENVLETARLPLKSGQDQLTQSANISSSSPDEQENTLTMPTQVVDDDDMQDSNETAIYEKHHMVVLGKLQRGMGDTTLYQYRLQYKERELRYKREVSQNEMQHEIKLQKSSQTHDQTGPILERYSMKKKPHGIAVIINNYKFDPSVNKKVLPNRRGSLVDEDNLLVTLKVLNYEVRTLRNLPASDITRKLMHISLESHKNYDSFVCCILSHGYRDGVYGADGDRVTISDIANIFKGSYCRDLVDKPKLFFIQACRGPDSDSGVVKEEDTFIDGDDSLHHSLPNGADFLFGYATPPGKVSFRSTKHGSWYISSLCQVLQENAHKLDLLSMLTIVNKEVCKAYTSQGDKQCPAPVSLLRKQVWFFES